MVRYCNEKNGRRGGVRFNMGQGPHGSSHHTAAATINSNIDYSNVLCFRRLADGIILF